MTIVLLDIDGTLIRTGRAGSRAMNRAFEDLFGVAGAFDGVVMAGRTDRWILNDAAARAGVDLGGDNVLRFRERYSARLTDALREPAPGKGVLPGVRRLLESLDGVLRRGERRGHAAMFLNDRAQRELVDVVDLSRPQFLAGIGNLVAGGKNRD